MKKHINIKINLIITFQSIELFNKKEQKKKVKIIKF